MANFLLPSVVFYLDVSQRNIKKRHRIDKYEMPERLTDSRFNLGFRNYFKYLKISGIEIKWINANRDHREILAEIQNEIVKYIK